MKTARLISTLATAVFFICCFLFFAVLYRYHLFFKEEMQAFLFTCEYFKSFFTKPAAISDYLGEFLMQFYYLPLGGATVITLSLLALWYITKRMLARFSIHESPFILSLLPVISTWVLLCSISYNLAPLISLLLVLIVFTGVTALQNTALRRSLSIILIPFLYVISGSSMFVFVLLSVIYDRIKKTNLQGYFFIAICAFISAIFPIIMHRYYLLTVRQSFLYIDGVTAGSKFSPFHPAALIILISLIHLLISNRWIRWNKSVIAVAVQLMLVSITGYFAIQEKADFTLEKILALDYEAYHNRWENVYNLSRKYKLRNRISAYYTNLALSKSESLPAKLMENYQPGVFGLFLPVTPDENYATITFSNEVYFQLGDVNASQHSALLGSIFSPVHRSSRLIKRLAEINIINAQYAAADKYLRILSKTLFYRKWAQERMKYLNDEKTCATASWIMEKRQQAPNTMELKGANEYDKTLKLLLEKDPYNRAALDYLLCFFLLNKDIMSFGQAYDQYCRICDIPLPDLYQEALMIYLSGTKATKERWVSYPLTASNLNRFANYTYIYEKSKGKGAPLQKAFGNTYWFYFHFARFNAN